VPRSQVGPDLSAVLTELGHDPAHLGAAGEDLKLTNQGGTLGLVQLRGKGQGHPPTPGEPRPPWMLPPALAVLPPRHPGRPDPAIARRDLDR